MLKNFQRVTENIYRGSAPDEKDLQMLHDIYKIKRIVSLDQAVGNNISPIVKNLSIEHIIIPINASDTQMTDSLNYLIRNIITLLTNNQPVYVHCEHGSDRTGLAVALYRVRRDGWTCEQALNEARKFGFGVRISPATQNLYKKILCGFAKDLPADMNAIEDDIVQEMRDTFQLGNVPPAFAPQQSWAPFSDIRREQDTFEDAKTELSPEDQKKLNRKEQLKEISNQIIPQVGNYENWSGVRGAGPVYLGGILQL